MERMRSKRVTHSINYLNRRHDRRRSSQNYNDNENKFKTNKNDNNPEMKDSKGSLVVF